MWTFFNNDGNCLGWCQCNAILVKNSRETYLYGTNTHNIANMVMGGSGPETFVSTADEHVGGWGGVVAGMAI